jgi:hypothetical protein
VFEHNRASDAERPQPRQPVWEIAESFAEKNSGLEQVGRIGAYSLSP